MNSSSRVAAIVACLLLSPSLAFALAARVSDSGWVASSSSTCTINYTPTSGTTLLIGVSQTASNSRTYSVSDGSAYTSMVELIGAGVRYAGIFARFNPPFSALTIVVTQAGGSATAFVCIALEVSEATAKDVSDSFDDVTSDMNDSASSAGINTATNVFVLVVGALNAAPGTGQTPGASYTELADAGNVQYFAQYKNSAGALTSETGAWTHANNGRLAVGVIVSIYAPTAGTRRGSFGFVF